MSSRQPAQDPHLTTFERELLGSSRTNLRRRAMSLQNLPWRDIGSAAEVTALASTELWGGRLVGRRSDQLLWRGRGEQRARDLVGGRQIVQFGCDGRERLPVIFGIGAGRLWVRTAVLVDDPWTDLDDATGLVSLGSWWSLLIALTSDGRPGNCGRAPSAD